MSYELRVVGSITKPTHLHQPFIYYYTDDDDEYSNVMKTIITGNKILQKNSLFGMIMVIICQSGATYFIIDGERRGYQKIQVKMCF